MISRIKEKEILIRKFSKTNSQKEHLFLKMTSILNTPQKQKQNQIIFKVINQSTEVLIRITGIKTEKFFCHHWAICFHTSMGRPKTPSIGNPP